MVASDILVIQLKRFLYESSPFASRMGIANRREKVTSLVHFPIEGLNMKPFVSVRVKSLKLHTIYMLYQIIWEGNGWRSLHSVCTQFS